MRFKPGDRVKISKDYAWARGAAATIDYPPEFARKLVEDESPWFECHRYIKGVNRLIEMYWVWFDQPQFDADGDGPYKGGEIENERLEPL
jgi:hypothetical protein